MKRLRGFTLAEVLITLGVIGVVAAITLSTVVNNLQKQAWVNQYKKTYSMLGQALEKMKADEGVTTFEQTELANVTRRTELFNILSKYLKTTDIKLLGNYKYSFLNSDAKTDDLSGLEGLFLANGAVIMHVDISKEANKIYISLHIDINGLKRPNIVGRDIYRFDIINDKFYPVGSKKYSEDRYTNKKDGINLRNWENGTQLYNCRLDKVSYGYGCGARILEKGKMDY